MKRLLLSPDQIVTLNDYPVHNNEILCEYFGKCSLGEKVPFVPVIRKEIVINHLDKGLQERFKRFMHDSPQAKYFMLDGSHRTTALTLAGCKIPVIVYEKSADIKEAKKLITKGQILESGTLEHTIDENCDILNDHFQKKPYFLTVAQKTKKMIQEKHVPKKILALYR